MDDNMDLDSDGDDLIRGIDESSLVSEKPATKRRRIHMDEFEILDYNKSKSGSVTLTNPAAVVKSTNDPNRGLYPRQNKKINNSSSSFKLASSMLNPRLPFLPDQYHEKKRLNSYPQSPRKLKSVMNSPIKQSGPGSILHYCFPSSQSSQASTKSSSSLNGASGSLTQSDSLSDDQIISCDSSQASTNTNNTCTPEKYDLTRRLFEAQKTHAASPKKKGVKIKPKKDPTFNRDNPFLYSGIDKNKSGSPTCSSDPLSMGVQITTNSSDSSDSDNDFSYFDELPVEIIQNIFCRLPFLDLYLSLTRVCSQWNDIVSDEKFIPWKKKYYKMKMHQKQSPEMQQIFSLMQQHGMTSTDCYLLELIKYMANYKRLDVKITKSLMKHKKFTWALELLKERAPECVHNEVANPWSLITAFCLIAEKVGDISEVITCLLSGDTYIMAIDVIECLYCIAAFLLCFKTLKYQDIWTSIHYKVYYALYLFENESTSCTNQLQSVFNNTGQQSLMRYSTNSELELTHEQMRIIKYDAKGAETAKIVAFAGTGKTTTLVKYTKLRPNKQFLLIVFNKSVKEHAARIFPPNVTCKTGHGLAFRPVGSRYKKKIGNYGLKIGNIIKVIKARKGISIYVQAKFVQDSLNKFMCSADELLTTAHVPTTLMGDDGTQKEIDHEQQMLIAKDAELIWNKMIDENDFGVQMAHDGYLKLFQLRKPKLWNFHMILIDEAQDLTPAVYDILMRQNVPKIFVGDPHQQIYSFRGAVNAMNLIQPTSTFYLTQSFRFGPEIAFVASSALEFLKAEKTRTLVGNAKDSSVLGDTKGQVAVITRTNFQLFGEAVKKCCYSQEEIKVAFAGGIEAFGLRTILAIHALMLPPDQRKPHQVKLLKEEFVGRFSGIGELEKYATKTQDNELLGKIRIVRTYTVNLPSLIDKIRKKLVSIPQHADIIFSTAHKAKGLEFQTVRLTDDYYVEPHPLTVGMYKASTKREDEGNLLYVAVTRAKKRLILTPTLMKLLDMSGERFLYPELSKNIAAEAQPFKCALTDREFTPCALTLVKKAVKLADGTTRKGGMLCPQVILEEMGSLRALYGSLKDERTSDKQEIDEERVEAENRDGWRFGLFEDYDDNLNRVMVHMGANINQAMQQMGQPNIML